MKVVEGESKQQVGNSRHLVLFVVIQGFIFTVNLAIGLFGLSDLFQLIFNMLWFVGLVYLIVSQKA
jgi:hypothetical protein